MLSLTTAQLLDAVIRGDLGEPVTRTAVREQATAATSKLFQVPLGKVALVTGITLQAGDTKSGIGANYQPSPGVSLIGVNVGTYGAPAFLSYRRPETHFMGTSTPTARSAPPDNVIKWKPKHPIPMPAGSQSSVVNVVESGTLGDFGNHSCIDMVWVDASHAASLRIDINADASKSRHQFTSQLATSSPAALLTGRKGLHLQIKDIFIRLQPGTVGANELRIYQRGNTANNGDNVEVDIWRFENNNIVDARDIVFSPDDIFLRAGADLFISTTIGSSATVAISAYYEDPNDCDANVFWSCIQPIKPGTTNGTAVPTGFGNARKVGVAFTPYYPKTNTSGPVTPGKGHQFLVHGLACSVQKGGGRFWSGGATKVADQTLFTISQGSASGDVQFTPITAQPNAQLIPVFYATEHDQNFLLVDDSKNCVCKADDGQVWLNALNLANTGSKVGVAGIGGDVNGAFGSVTTTDADISAWSFSIWGRRISTRFRTPDLLGV